MEAKIMKNTTFPALRCKMGEWVYYLTFFRFADVKEWIQPTDEIHPSPHLRDMIQRALTKNVDMIAEYLIHQEERFFNAIVVGVYGGAPQWFPIEVASSPVLGEPELSENERSSIGVLQFEGDEELFAIDGQHRVEGIKKAILQSPTLENDELSVILVAHETTERGRQRTRRLFTTLNKMAKPVTKADIIALDEDDAFAIVTRRMVEEFPLLRSESRHETKFVHFGSQPSLNTNDSKNLTTIRTIYEICSAIYMPILAHSPQQMRKSIIGDRRVRPPDQIIDEAYQESTDDWNYLVAYFAEYEELFSSSPDDEIAGEYRANGGHFMFRPVGQQAFVRAVRILMDRRFSMEQAVEDLAKVPMNLHEPPWLNVLWDPRKEKIIRNFGQQHLEGILLYMVGQEPRRRNLNLLEKYRIYVGDDHATLPDPVTGTLL
jgi:DNA sulfur modification protein DndB